MAHTGYVTRAQREYIKAEIDKRAREVSRRWARVERAQALDSNESVQSFAYQCCADNKLGRRCKRRALYKELYCYTHIHRVEL